MTTITMAAPRPINLHIGLAQTMRNSFALAGRAIVRIRKNPETLLDVTIQPIIFLILFTYLLGGAIGGSTTDYLQFLLPGLMAQNTAFASIGIGQALNTDI